MPLSPEGRQAAELDDRLRVVVHAKVADAIDAFRRSPRRSELLDYERGRLLPAAVATRSLTGFERCHQPLGKRREGVGSTCAASAPSARSPFRATTPIACVATAPMPARTHGVTAPIAKYFD